MRGLGLGCLELSLLVRHGASLQLQLLNGIQAIDALLAAHLGQAQLARIERGHLGEQSALLLGQANVEVTVHDLGHQGHARRLQLRLCAQQLGFGRTLVRLARAEQAQVPEHVDAGVEI